MDIFFIDDSSQSKPIRPKMGRMVAIGGLVISSDNVRPLEQKLDQLCLDYSFPPNEVFKWSPGRDKHWMRDNLTGDDRRDFQIAVMKSLEEYGCKAIFVAEDAECKRAEESSETPEIDVVKLLIERIDGFLRQQESYGLIICDRPGGDYKNEESFLLKCLETIRSGTNYVIPERIVMSVLTSPFRLSRILQAADLITSCTLAYVAGEINYAPILFPYIWPLFIRANGCIGGVGVKLHPDKKYINLYHWLFNDKDYVRDRQQLPFKNCGYPNGPDNYS